MLTRQFRCDHSAAPRASPTASTTAALSRTDADGSPGQTVEFLTIGVQQTYYVTELARAGTTPRT